ncbi:MAG: hypothetical protein JJT90_04005 [Ectothiorhodospiraceae bacterium]|nr:hypothetical protein [Ectothiorhodospiraceae bacterium]
MVLSSNTQGWFGDFNLDVHHTLEWRVGPLTFWVYRGEHEWRLRSDGGGDPLSPTAETVLREERQADVEDSKVQRFLLTQDSPRLSVGVMLPDRPVVSKPASPVSIPAGESVSFYLSYPVWLTLSVGDPPRKLAEFPSQRLSDTWFGPNTREGMLCYATRSRCRLNLSDHPHVPNRAITQLLIRNQGQDALTLDRVKLPVATLSLYRSLDRNWLWTQTVSLLRQEGGDMAELKLGSGVPEEAGRCELVAQPRELPQRGTLVRAFSQLF